MGNRPKVKKFKESTDDGPEQPLGEDPLPVVAEIEAKHHKPGKGKKRKLLKQQQQSESKKESVKPSNALHYLECWSKRKVVDWKYRKSQHVWLLRHWRNSKLIDDPNFKRFIKYMRRDGARQKLIDDCTKLIESGEASEEVLERARTLVQSL